MSSAGRIVALALVVASLVLAASPGAALAKGSGGRAGGRSFGGHSSGSSSRSSGSSNRSSGSSSSRSYSGSSSSSRGTRSAASSAGSATAIGGGGGGHSTHITTVYGGGGYVPMPYYPAPSPYYDAYEEDPLPTSTATRSAAVADYGTTAYEEDQEDNLGFIMAVIMVVYGYSAIGDIVRGPAASADGSSGSSSSRSAGEPGVAVCRVQVAVLASAREELQAELAALVERVDTRTASGLHTLLHESVLLLLRHREAFAYGAVQETSAAGEAAAEAAFDRLSLSERSRFKEETLLNVQGRKQRSSGSSSHRNGSGGGSGSSSRPGEDELVVVTFLLAARPQPSAFGGDGDSETDSPLLGLRTAAAAKGSSSSSISSSTGRSTGRGLFGGFERKSSGVQLVGDLDDSGWVQRLDGAQGLSRALLALSGVRPGQVLAVEVMWTPEAPGDTFSRTDLLEDYPHLQPL